MTGSQFSNSIYFRSSTHNTKMSAPAPPTAEELAAKAGALKSGGDTKAADALALDPEAVAALTKAYNDAGGDKAKLAAATGIDAAKFDAKPFSDAASFATNVLSGQYAD